MPGQAQREDGGSRRVHVRSEGAHAVGRIGQTVQHQHPDHRVRRFEHKAAVPVRGPALGVGDAATPVAVDAHFVGRRLAAVNLFVELRKQPVLERKIRLEAGNLGILSKLLVEMDFVPNLEIRPALDHHHRARDKDDRCPHRTVEEGPQRVPERPYRDPQSEPVLFRGNAGSVCSVARVAHCIIVSRR